MIHYDVNVTTGEVTASITGCQDDVLKKVKKYFGGINIDDKALAKCKLKDTFTARARCHPEDTFDEEVGKKIAKGRLLNKYHVARVKAMVNFTDIFDQQVDMVLEWLDTEDGIWEKYNGSTPITC